MLPLFRVLLSLTSVGLLTTVFLHFGIGASDLLSEAALSTKPLSSGGSLSSDEVLSFRERILSKDKDDKPWDQVYIVNLTHRTDRREHMVKLADALGINVTFFDAVSKMEPVVPWIIERMHDEQIARETFDGPPEDYRDPPIWGKNGDLRWRQHALSVLPHYSTRGSPPSFLPTPPLPTFPPRSSPLPSSATPFSWPPSWLPHFWKPVPAQGMTGGVLSHLSIWTHALSQSYSSILILEDDVDAELELVSRWKEMKRSLERRAQGWDMVFLGYQWSFEGVAKPTFHPQLRKAHEPMGAWAYSLSARGVARILHHFTHSETLFLRPIDHEFAWGLTYPAHHNEGQYAEEGSFVAYSAFPPVMAPGDGSLGTDVGGGAGDDWGGLLADSTWERIARAEGREVRRLGEEEVWGMPFIQRGLC